MIYKAINRERGNNCLPKVKGTKKLLLFFYFILFYFYIFSYFFLCQPPSHSLLLPADRQPSRPRVGFYLLVAGLINPIALLMRAKFFNLPVPIGQDLFNSPALHDGSFNNN